MSVDLKSNWYPDKTPYNFSENNPINIIDPNGMWDGERGNRTLGDFVFYRCHEFLVLLSKPYKHRA
jgi:hypothetical protein